MTTNKEISTLYEDNLVVSDDEKKTIKSENKEESTNRPKCRLDANGRLNLKDILISFNEPVNQERAWALCYQTAKSFSRLPDNNFYELLELSQIVLHKDGDVWLGNLIGKKADLHLYKKGFFFPYRIYSLLSIYFKFNEKGSVLNNGKRLKISSMTSCKMRYLHCVIGI